MICNEEASQKDFNINMVEKEGDNWGFDDPTYNTDEETKVMIAKAMARLSLLKEERKKQNVQAYGVVKESIGDQYGENNIVHQEHVLSYFTFFGHTHHRISSLVSAEICVSCA